MVDKGMLALTKKKTLAEAWRCFVKPDDKVGIKLNSGAGDLFIGTKTPIFEAVIDGVRAAGVPDKNIIVWDQVDMYLQYALKRWKIEKPEEGGIRYIGCTPKLDPKSLDKPLPGYETDPVKFDWGEIRVAELVANEMTAIINIPVLKDHSCSGVTLALKNISHAVVNIPWLCHADCCDPSIADIVNIPCVRDKLRLHILDGIFGLADGGPGRQPLTKFFRPEKLLFSADPVAIDTIGCEWVVAARKEMEFPPLEEAKNAIEGVEGRSPKHIATAAGYGLGTNDRNQMDIVKVDFPPMKTERKEPAKEKG